MKFDVIIPTFHTYELCRIVIQSFEKFRPRNVKLRYIVVENSEDVSYKDNVIGLAEEVVWISNPAAVPEVMFAGSFANSSAIEIAKKIVNTEYIFLLHSDTCVSSKLFFENVIKKIKEGYELIGTGIDGARINALHVSGLVISNNLLQAVNSKPHPPQLDVGDSYTKYCREKDIKHFCFRNTINDSNLVDKINEPYRSWGEFCGVDRCVDENNNVIFLHFGRGTQKSFRAYHKENRFLIDRWILECDNIIGSKTN